MLLVFSWPLWEMISTISEFKGPGPIFYGPPDSDWSMSSRSPWCLPFHDAVSSKFILETNAMDVNLAQGIELVISISCSIAMNNGSVAGVS